MTISNVQAAKYGSAASNAVTVSWTSTPTAGNLLIARAVGVGASDSGAITDWTKVTSAQYGATTGHVAIFYKIAGAGEGNVTVTFTGSNPTRMVIEEWSNTAGWVSSDVFAKTDNTGSTVTSRSTGTTGTTAVADELAVSVLGCGSAITGISWSNSFTASFEQPTGALTFAGAHKTLAATGTVETTASWTTARLAGACVATFKGNDAITGTLSQTQADDSLSSAGVIALTGVVTQTQAGDSLGATGTVSLSGVLSQTQADDTLSSAAVISITGALSQTQASDTVSSAATIALAGVLAQTQEGDVLSSSAVIAITGILSQTQEGDTLVSTGILSGGQTAVSAGTIGRVVHTSTRKEDEEAEEDDLLMIYFMMTSYE